jgi:cullin-4
MFEQGKNDQLKTMFEVFSRAPGCVNFISTQMNDFIMLEGTKILSNVDNLKDPIKFTTELLAFKKKFDDIIIFSFQNEMNFQKSRDQSFMLFMNGCNLTAHYICVYFDAQLKSAFK